MACLTQSSAPLGMTMDPGPNAPQDCSGHMADDACDCCPDGLATGTDCQSLCGLQVTLASNVIEPVKTIDEFPPEILAAARAGPNYIPLNPPPIA
jgi:hypothetical protein